MPSFSAVRSANAAWKYPSQPVALFVGGTSGIGQGTAEALARHTNGNAHIIICGRNRAAADEIIASFPKADGATHEFVECDVSLMKNVHATTASLLQRLPKLNYLVMSTGFLSMQGRDETEEGIDRKLAAHYYSRWAFTSDLVPLLEKAASAGEDAKVMTVLAAGKGGAVNADDLGLKKTFSVVNAALQGPAYNDLMCSEFGTRYPSISFTHTHPGGVRTPLFSTMLAGSYFRFLTPVLMGLVYPITVSREASGEYMLYAMLQSTAGVVGRRGSRGEDIGRQRWLGTQEEQKKLWEHTVKAVTPSSS